MATISCHLIRLAVPGSIKPPPVRIEAIRAQIRRTVLLEIAHHFGISDVRLRELGAY